MSVIWQDGSMRQEVCLRELQDSGISAKGYHVSRAWEIYMLRHTHFKLFMELSFLFGINHVIDDIIQHSIYKLSERDDIYFIR